MRVLLWSLLVYLTPIQWDVVPAEERALCSLFDESLFESHLRCVRMLLSQLPFAAIGHTAAAASVSSSRGHPGASQDSVPAHSQRLPRWSLSTQSLQLRDPVDAPAAVLTLDNESTQPLSFEFAVPGDKVYLIYCDCS